MRFRPSGGFGQNQKPDRSALQARAEATSEKKPDSLFERARHEQEIERAENIAAGLPPEGRRRGPRRRQEPWQHEPGGRGKRGAFRKPHLETPPEVEEEKYEPVPCRAPPAGWWSTLNRPRPKSSRKVQRLIKPEAKTHKELIINAESLETPRRPGRARQAGGIHHRAHHGGAPGGQHLQRQGPEP